MNQQERDSINQLLMQLVEVKLSSKDPEADTLIRATSAKQPDALYLLVQRNLLMEHALNNAKAQIEDMQAQVQANQQTKKNGFFDNNPWGQSVNNSAQQAVSANRYAPQPTPLMQPGGSFLGGGASFLGNMATTAAGVVAGSFLFQGIENLMGHHATGFGSQAYGQASAEPNVVNNYYGNDAVQTASADDSFQDENNSADFMDDSDYPDTGDDSSWT